MKLKQELLRLLPTEDELFSNLSNTIGSDKILSQIYQSIVKENNTEERTRKSLEFLDVIIDFLHESLHVGEWHAVDVKLRKSFSVACYFKVLNLLSGGESSQEGLQECAYLLDMGIMLGDRIFKKVEGEEETEVEVLPKAAQMISSCLESMRSDEGPSKKRLKIEVDYERCDCDIPILDKPSIENFM